MTLTLKDLIAKAFEREGFVFVSLEHTGDDGGEPCWDITLKKDGKLWKGGWTGVDWLGFGPGSELQIYLANEGGGEEVRITLGGWEEEEHECRVRRLVDTLTTRHSQLLEWAPSFFFEKDVRKLEMADDLLCSVLERLASY